MNLNDDELLSRIQADLEDSYDEELELELEDRNTDALAAALPGGQPGPDREARRAYFRELFRLQRELVKLQDWVQHSGHKVVILFEGRDAAGKGGVIKRITQRLNPRVARVVALPAPNDRERTHIAEAPWWVVSADDKKKARLNCIAHLLQQMPYAEVERDAVVLPPRVRNEDYVRQPVPPEMIVPARY